MVILSFEFMTRLSLVGKRCAFSALHGLMDRRKRMWAWKSADGILDVMYVDGHFAPPREWKLTQLAADCRANVSMWTILV
jgi:hypothetical protein